MLQIDKTRRPTGCQGSLAHVLFYSLVTFKMFRFVGAPQVVVQLDISVISEQGALRKSIS